jgi:hypothetical protein
LSVSLTSNFLQNARGITFLDGGGVTWSINKSTNEIKATAAGGAGIGTVTSIGSSTLTIGGTSAVPTVNLSSTQVTDIAAGGTALQSVTTTDSIQGAGTSGSPVELVGDSATPGNSYFYGTNSSGVKGWYASSAAANPSSKVGLSAVNGSATTFMRSDAAPQLDQAISPTWTSNHAFSAEIIVNSTCYFVGNSANGYRFNNAANTVNLLVLADNGNASFSGPIGVNGASPPAQSTGWGTPTGGSVQNNFAGGSASLATTSAAVAQIIAVLKAAGFLGA